jgi:hypothetical protein
MSLECCSACKHMVSIEANPFPKCGHALETGWAEKRRAIAKMIQKKYLIKSGLICVESPVAQIWHN